MRFDRPNTATGTITQKDACFEVEELRRLMKTASVVPGTKVDIFWPQERRYYTAIIKTEQTRKRENFLICYEDARHQTKEWIDLHRHKFRIIAQPAAEDDVIVVRAAATTPQRTVSNSSNASPTPHTATVASPLDGATNSGTPTKQHIVESRQHPAEVLIVPELANPKLVSTDSGSVTKLGTIKKTIATNTTVQSRTSDVASKPYMHLVSNVPSNAEDFEPTTTDNTATMDTSQGGTISSIEPPRTIISMEMEDDMKKFDSSDRHDFCSPGNSSTSTNHSVVLDVPQRNHDNHDGNVPELGPTSHDLQNDRSHLAPADQCSVRRISQDTITDTNNTIHEAPSNKVEGDDSATVKCSEHVDNVMKDNIDEEEGIVIDPDNDEATQTAIFSLIQIGSRVSVYSEFDDQFYPGTITDRKYRGKPFYIQYDDDDEGWIDLRKQRFRLLPSATSTSSSASNFLTEQDIGAIGTNGYRSTRRSSSMRMLPDGKIPSQQPSADTTLKRSERSSAKPIRFQDSSELTDSNDEGIKSDKPEPRKKRVVNKPTQSDNEIDKIKIGTRIAVWWGGDRRYYNAIVTRQRSYKKPFFIEYEGTDETEWIDFRKNKFKILPANSDPMPGLKMEDHTGSAKDHGSSQGSPKRFRLGSPEKSSRPTEDHDSNVNGSAGTDKKRKMDLPNDANADNGILDNDFNVGNNEDVYAFIKVGTRVSVYWEGDSKYYDGTVTRERENAQKKHYLEYDDGEAAHWIDFREHWVRIIPPKNTPAIADANLTADKKRKVECVVDDSSSRPKRLQVDKKAGATRKDSKPRLKKSDRATVSTVAKEISNVKDESKQQLSTKGKTKGANMQKSGESKSTLAIKSKILVGTRVEVWWDGDAQYYKGTVLRIGPNNSNKFFVRYDDNEEAWVLLSRNRVRLLDPTSFELLSRSASKTSYSTSQENNQVRKIDSAVATSKLNNVVTTSGKRAATKSDHGDESNAKGNRARAVKPTSKKIESESENSDESDASSSSSSLDHYAYTDFVYGNVDNVKVGSRVAVWWPGNRRYFDGTVEQIGTSSKKRYFIKYDDDDTEWTDLKKRYYRLLD